MRELKPKEEPKRCRRVRSRDQESWRKGAIKGTVARWALRNLPPIDPDDPWSTELYTEEG